MKDPKTTVRLALDKVLAEVEKDKPEGAHTISFTALYDYLNLTFQDALGTPEATFDYAAAFGASLDSGRPPSDLAGLAARDNCSKTPQDFPESPGSKASRTDPTKLRFDLIPPESERALAEVFSYGARKYESRNWEKGLPWSELIAAIRRHLQSILEGELLDPESSFPHAYHLHTNTAMLLTLMARRPDLNDLPRPRRP